MFYINEILLKDGDINRLSEDEQDSVNTVLNTYGDMEPYDLRELSHSEAPWKIARGLLDKDVSCSNIITKESMGEFYGSL